MIWWYDRYGPYRSRYRYGHWYHSISHSHLTLSIYYPYTYTLSQINSDISHHILSPLSLSFHITLIWWQIWHFKTNSISPISKHLILWRLPYHTKSHHIAFPIRSLVSFMSSVIILWKYDGLWMFMNGFCLLGVEKVFPIWADIWRSY